MGEKIEFQGGKSSFGLLGKIEFPSKRTKKACIDLPSVSCLILSFEKGGFWWQGCVSERVAAGEAGPEVDPDGPGRGLGNPEGEHQTH